MLMVSEKEEVKVDETPVQVYEALVDGNGEQKDPVVGEIPSSSITRCPIPSRHSISADFLSLFSFVFHKFYRLHLTR